VIIPCLSFIIDINSCTDLFSNMFKVLSTLVTFASMCLAVIFSAFDPAHAETSVERYHRFFNAAASDAADGRLGKAEDKMFGAILAAQRVQQLGDENFVAELVKAYLQLGIIQEEEHSLKAAERSFNKGMDVSDLASPGDYIVVSRNRNECREHLIKIWQELASLAADEHRYQDAIDNFKKITAFGRHGGLYGNRYPNGQVMLPEDEGFWSEVSTCYRKTGNLKEAERIEKIAKVRLELCNSGVDALFKARDLLREVRELHSAHNLQAAQTKINELLAFHRQLEYAPGEEYKQALDQAARLAVDRRNLEDAKSLYEELVQVCKDQHRPDQAEKYEKIYRNYVADTIAAGSSTVLHPVVEILPAQIAVVTGAQKWVHYSTRNGYVAGAHFYLSSEKGNELTSRDFGWIEASAVQPAVLEDQPGIFTGVCVYHAPARVPKDPVYINVETFDKDLRCGVQRIGAAGYPSSYEGKDPAGRQVASARARIYINDLTCDFVPGREITLHPGTRVRFKFTIHNVDNEMKFRCIRSFPTLVNLDLDDPARNNGSLTVAGEVSQPNVPAECNATLILRLEGTGFQLDRHVHFRVRP